MMESAEISFDHALNATNALYIRPLRTPNVVELPAGVVKPNEPRSPTYPSVFKKSPKMQVEYQLPGFV